MTVIRYVNIVYDFPLDRDERVTMMLAKFNAVPNVDNLNQLIGFLTALMPPVEEERAVFKAVIEQAMTLANEHYAGVKH